MIVILAEKVVEIEVDIVRVEEAKADPASVEAEGET